jgi:hypothetical protein
MARERVQVQGLRGAVPGIQPTIQRAGQYSVQVQRAGRNKLMDLADALGEVNPVLQQYTRVADLEAEQFDEELAGMSLEEQQAMLKKTEDELDKETRRGVIGWLTSPLNQKRKRKAIGKLASRDLVNEIRVRMVNPKQGDPEDLTERANFIRQEYIDNTPALQSSVFAQEGLNENTRSAIEGIIGDYEVQQAAQAKKETIYATASSFYDNIYNITGAKDIQEALARGEFGFVPENEKQSLGDILKREWEATGANTAAEQRAILQSVVKRLAADGLANQADGLRDWAKTNLKFGNADMSKRFYNELTEIIEDAEATSETQEKRERIDKVGDIFAEFKRAYDDIDIFGKTGSFGGVEYDNVSELMNIAMRDPRVAGDNTATTDLSDQVKDWTRRNFNPKERAADELKASTTGLQEVNTLLGDKLKNHITTKAIDLQNDERQQTANLNARIEFSDSINNKALDLNEQDLTEKERKRQLLQFTREEEKRIFGEFKKEVSALKDIKEKEDAEDERTNKFLQDEESKLKAVERGRYKLSDLFGYEADDTDLAEIETNLKVLGAKEAVSEEKAKAMDYIQSYGRAASAILANKLDPNAWKEEPYLSKFAAEDVGRYVGGERYSSDEVEGMLNRWMNINGFLDTFTDIELLKRGVSNDGNVIFDVADFKFRSKITRLLSLETLEDAKDITNEENMPEEVKEKASLIGIEDTVQFVKDQRELAKRLRLIR